MNDLSVLSTAVDGVIQSPPKIVIYGDEGGGKSTTASNAPSPYMLNIEDGLKFIEKGKKTPQLKTYNDVLTHVTALCTDDHKFGTVVLDTATGLERLIQKHTAEKNGKKSISDIGYGNGYKLCLDYWQDLIDAFNYLNAERGMVAIIVAHAQVEKYKDPESEAYDRQTLRLRPEVTHMLFEWSDAVLFATQRKRIETEDLGFKKTRSIAKAIGADGGERILKTVRTPAVVAKNRFGITGDIPLSWEAFAAYL